MQASDEVRNESIAAHGDGGAVGGDVVMMSGLVMYA